MRASHNFFSKSPHTENCILNGDCDKRKGDDYVFLRKKKREKCVTILTLQKFPGPNANTPRPPDGA